MHKIKKTLRALGAAASIMFFTSYSDKQTIDSYHLESGVNISCFQKSDFSIREKQSIDKLVNDGYSSININIGYLQDDQVSSNIDPEPLFDSVHVSKLMDYAASRGLKIYLRPFINCKDNSSRKEILPKDPDKWFSDYDKILKTLLKNHPRDYDLYICSELDMLLLSFPGRFSQLVQNIKETGFDGKIIHSIIFNYDLDTNKISLLNNIPVDMIGIDFYVSMVHEDLDENHKFYEPKYYIDRIFDKSKKPVIFTELGYRSIVNGASMPLSHQDKGLAVDYGLQQALYENFIKALLSDNPSTEKNMGLFFWITDTPIYTDDIFLSSAYSQDGYSFFGKPAESAVKEYNKKRLFFKYRK